jgi:uncharacterized phiE125 gp8 family phage protein
MSRSVTTITPPAELPVTVAELKDHLRLAGDDGSHDAMLAQHIEAAVQLLEHETNTAMVTRTLRLTLDEFPPVIHLLRPPAAVIVAIRYIDDNGQQQTLPPEDYHANLDRLVGRVSPAYGKCWPTTRRQLGAVSVEFQAGYGVAADVPHDLKAAVKLLAAHYYDLPAAATSLNLNEAPYAVGAIIAQNRTMEIGS